MFSFKRWIPTFIAFPIGSSVAMATVGSLHDPASAAAGGLLAGAIIGGAQAFALGTGARWAAVTAGAMAAGAALAAAITGAGTETADVVLAGAITGAAVGAAQTLLLGRRALPFAAVTAGAWALGWLTTSGVIVDLDRGHHVFGASGAIVATSSPASPSARSPATPRPSRSRECPGWDSNPHALADSGF